MAKVQQISEITPSFAFTEFDFYKDYEESFKKCEIGRIHALAYLIAKMEHDENRHNLAIGHTRRTPPADLALGTQKRHIFNFFFIFLAKFIRSTENFYNFVVGNHGCILV